jgi:hypothetical protein
MVNGTASDSAITISTKAFEEIVREVAKMGVAVEGVTGQIKGVRKDLGRFDARLDAHLGPDGAFQKLATDVAVLKEQGICRDRATARNEAGIGIPYEATPSPENGLPPLRYAKGAVEVARRWPYTLLMICIGVILGVGATCVLLSKLGVL